MTESIGMMEGAFFVSRSDLLDWINEVLKLNLVKIEQTASGAVACQIIDAIYPGTVNMHRVNWKATQEYEFINNYKVLQQAFSKHKISKVIEVEKLSKGRCQDNLEFMQWLKRYFDLNGGKAADYDPVARRKDATLPPVAGKEKPASKHVATVPSGKAPKEVSKHQPVAAAKKSPTKTAVEEAKKAADGFKKERDFYFGKLRSIEILLDLNEKDKTPILEKIRKVLYAGEDDKVEIDSDGNVKVKDESSPAKGDAAGTKLVAVKGKEEVKKEDEKKEEPGDKAEPATETK